MAVDVAIRLQHRLPSAPSGQAEIAADDVTPVSSTAYQMSADVTPMAGDQDL